MVNWKPTHNSQFTTCHPQQSEESGVNNNTNKNAHDNAILRQKPQNDGVNVVSHPEQITCHPEQSEGSLLVPQLTTTRNSQLKPSLDGEGAVVGYECNLTNAGEVTDSTINTQNHLTQISKCTAFIKKLYPTSHETILNCFHSAEWPERDISLPFTIGGAA